MAQQNKSFEIEKQELSKKYNSKDKHGNCVFCKIADGTIKTPGIFFENKEYMTFLSTFPNTEGFSVVIPKKHFGSDVLKMPDKELAKFILIAKKSALMIEKAMSDVGRVGLIMEGTGIDHAHIKLFPMHQTEHMKKGVWKQYLSNKSDYFEKYEGYMTSTDGPAADNNKLKILAEKIKKSN